MCRLLFIPAAALRHYTPNAAGSGSETGLHFQIVAEIDAACVVVRHHEVHQ